MLFVGKWVELKTMKVEMVLFRKIKGTSGKE
jgi:hypothetical protein